MPATEPLAAPAVDAVLELLERPLLELVFEAAGVHRAHHDPARVQCSQLLSIKTGGCPEDCGYCSQSAHHKTPVAREPLMALEDVLAAARAAKAGGSDRFCMGAAWREVKDGPEFERVLDMVRAELEPNGPPNIPEFGSHKTEAGFRALLAMSTYHHIEEGIRYPAVLLLHGVNDPRVAVWHSAKTAARFAAASATVTGGKPVLLRLDYDAGHGVGSTRQQRQRETADVYAFLLWQMGVKGFQP